MTRLTEGTCCLPCMWGAHTTCLHLGWHQDACAASCAYQDGGRMPAEVILLLVRMATAFDEREG